MKLTISSLHLSPFWHLVTDCFLMINSLTCFKLSFLNGDVEGVIQKDSGSSGGRGKAMGGKNVVDVRHRVFNKCQNLTI